MKRFLIASSVLALTMYALTVHTSKAAEAKPSPGKLSKTNNATSTVQGTVIPPASLPPSVSTYKTTWNSKPMTAYRYEPQGTPTTYLMVVNGSTVVSGESCQFNGGSDVGVNVKYVIQRSAPHNAVARKTDGSSYPSFTFPNAWELAGCGRIGAVAAPKTYQPPGSSLPISPPSNPVSSIQAVDLEALPKAKRQLSPDVTVSTSTENGKRLNNYRYSGPPSEEKYGEYLSIFENTTEMGQNRDGRSEYCHFKILHNGREREVYTSSRNPNWVLDGVQNTENLNHSPFPNVWALAGCYRYFEIPASVSQFKTLWNEKPATGYRNEHLSGDASYLIVLDGTTKIVENSDFCTFNGGNTTGANQKLGVFPDSPDEIYDRKSLTLAFLFPNAWKLAGCGGR
jgi:hypothetical protein